VSDLLALLNEDDPVILGAAVRRILDAIAAAEPGRSVEIRVPPFAAVQAIAGATHRRGTPPAVVEMDAHTLIALAAGQTSWATAQAAGRIEASGERSDLTRFFPLPTL
jgi:hypothetical protein